MQGPDFLFFMQDKNNNFYQQDGSLSANPYPLANAPIGWETITIENNRNFRLWGVDRQVSANLDFVGDGGTILKTCFYSIGGTEADCYLTICKQELDYQTGVGWKYWYRQVFKGSVDFSTFVHDGPKVSVKTLEDGLPKYIKSNENTLYTFPMTDPNIVWVKMDGVRLLQIAHYGITDGLRVGQYRFIGDLPLLGTDGDNAGGVLLSEVYEALPDTAAAELSFLQGSQNFFFENDTTQNIQINVYGIAKFVGATTNFSVANGIRGYVKVSRDNSLGSAVQYQLFDQPFTVFDTNYSVNFNINITAIPGDKLFFVCNAYVNNSYFIEFLPDSRLNASFPTRREATYAPHFTGIYLFTELLKKVTDGTYTPSFSPLLQTMYKDVLFTCGNSIRGIQNPEMQISLEIFRQFFDCINSVGFIEMPGNKVLFDVKQGLFDITKAIALPGPSYPPKFNVSTEYLFNELSIGFPEIRNDVGALNGNQEWNCTVRRSLGTTVKPGKIDKVSKIKASCYEQEKIRITLFTKDSTDNKNDNDVYANWCESATQPSGGAIPPHRMFDRSLNPLVTAGLFEAPTVWNLRLSPGLSTLANGPFLRSCTFNMDNRILAWVSSDKNSALVCNGVAENADYQIGQLGAPYFKPVEFDILVPAPFDLINMMTLNPLQVFTFPFKRKTWVGISIKTSISPSDNRAQQYRLLAVPLNNFTDLINYAG